MTFQTSSVAPMRMTTTKRWWVGLATLVISRLALETMRDLRTMMKMKGTDLEEGVSFTNDGEAIIKMMNLVSEALDLKY